MNGVKIEEKADVAIVSSYPEDSSLFHAELAASLGAMVTKERGTVVLVFPCYDGIKGSPPYYTAEQFYDLMVERPTPENALCQLLRRELVASGGGFVYGWSRVLQDKEILLVTKGIAEDQLKKMGLRHADSVQSALDYSMEKHGPDAKVAVLDSTSVLPLVKG